MEQYEHDIRRFVSAMVYKLKVHHKKGRWEDLSVEEAMRRLREEVEEVEEALRGGNFIESTLELADVANFALIAASIVTERGK